MDNILLISYVSNIYSRLSYLDPIEFNIYYSNIRCKICKRIYKSNIKLCKKCHNNFICSRDDLCKVIKKIYDIFQKIAIIICLIMCGYFIYSLSFVVRMFT